MTSIDIPDGVTSIGDWAFAYCNALTTVVIPDSVTSIGWEVFESLQDIFYSGSKEQWNAINIGPYNESWENATIHYNSTGPEIDADSQNSSVHFFSRWNSETHEAFFDNSALAYNVTGKTDLSAVESVEALVGKYVLVETDETQIFNITSIRPVESAIGTVSTAGEHTVTIDGAEYPVWEDLILDFDDGKEVLYHTYDGTVMGLDILEERTGTLEKWDGTTGYATINGTIYPTNYLSDLSFQNDIEEYLSHGVIYYTAGSADYTPLIKIAGTYYPGGDLDDFNADIYHATWLSKGGNAANILDNQTPSQIMVDAMDEAGVGSAIDMWRSFELVFDTLNDASALYDFAVAPKDVYSALILDALEASVTYDVIGSEYEDGLKLSKDIISSLSTALKANYKINLENSEEFQDALDALYALDVDADEFTEEIVDEWFKIKQPDLKSLGKSFKWFSTGLKTVSTIEDFVEYCAACYTLSQVSDAIVEVLERGYKEAERVYGPLDNITLAFKECLDMITHSTSEMIDQIGNKGITVITKNAAKYIVGDMLWSEVANYVGTVCPEIEFLQLGYKAGKTISNIWFNTDDTAEQYLKMRYATDIESIIDNVYYDLEHEFDRTHTLKLASAYLSAMKLSFSLRDVDTKAAYKYVDIIDSSLVSKIGKLLGAEGDTELKNKIEIIKIGYSDSYFAAETGWIPSLYDDYPGSGLYEAYNAMLELEMEQCAKKEIVSKCPVNVYVYDNADNVVASVVDGRVRCNADDIVVALIGDTKIIRFYGSKDYRIEYVGYDLGTMDVTISEFDAKEDVVRTVNYYDIPLMVDIEYGLDIDNTTLVPDAYCLENTSNGETIAYDFDSLQSAGTKYTISIKQGVIIHNAEPVLSADMSAGETASIIAYVPDGYSFVRWETTSGDALIEDTFSPNTVLFAAEEDVTIRAIIQRDATEAVPVTALTLEPSALTLTVGDTTALTSAISPSNADNKTIIWTSSNETVATVDVNGTVIAVSEGHAVITASTLDGGYTKTCDVQVNKPSSEGTSPLPPVYTASVTEPSHGAMKISPTWAVTGEKVTLTVTPDDGYVLNSLVVTDNSGKVVAITDNGDGTYSFTMPQGGVTVTATFKLKPCDGGEDCPSHNFTDVDHTAWYHEGADYAIAHKLMFGKAVGIFAPNGITTRAEMVTILYRLDGEPTVTGDAMFDDVPGGQWYSDAINWAAANEIVGGYGNGKFGPDDTITREQMAAILYRYASYKGYDMTKLADLTGYTDADTVSDWAVTAMRWAVAEGIINGTSTTTLSPSGDSTRAQVATIFMRFGENIVK